LMLLGIGAFLRREIWATYQSQSFLAL
jgi:hypothetical protein